MTHHGYVFMSIATITELQIENGEPLMNVEYEDPYLDNHYYPENLQEYEDELADDNSSFGGSTTSSEK